MTRLLPATVAVLLLSATSSCALSAFSGSPPTSSGPSVVTVTVPAAPPTSTGDGSPPTTPVVPTPVVPTPVVPAPAPAPSLPPRTADALQAALLTVQQVGPGYAARPVTTGGGAASADPRCEALVRYLNAPTTPGTIAAARVLYQRSGGRLHLLLDAMPSPEAAATLLRETRDAVQACPRVTFVGADGNSGVVNASIVAPPAVGTDPVAIRFSGSGVDYTNVATRSGDLVVTIMYLGTSSADAGRVLAAQWAKATQQLGTLVPVA